MKIEKSLYLFLKVFSVIVAVGGTVLIGVGVFSILTPGGIIIASISFTSGAALLAAVKALASSCEKLKEKFNI